MIRVMIVATYIEVREGLSTLLRLAGGIEVRCAASLSSAVQQAGETRPDAILPDAILVDLEMAQGEGREALGRLKRLCPSAKIIALTAHDYPAAQQRALQAGADAVLVKGVAAAEMVEAIRAAAGTHSPSKE